MMARPADSDTGNQWQSNASEWDRCAVNYRSWADNVTGPHARWMLERVLDADVTGGQSELSVIDVACGDGALSLALAARTDRVASVLASDYSAAMCGQLDQQVSDIRAKAKAEAEASDAGRHGDGPRASLQLAPVRTLVADAQDLSSVPSDSLDVCVCSFGLMLIPDGRRALSEMKRVVKAGGVVAVASWAPLQSQLYVFMTHLVDHVHVKHAEHRRKAASSSNGGDASASSSATADGSSGPSFAESTRIRLANMPFSRLSEYADAFAHLGLQPVLLSAHTEQTGEYGNAGEFWDAIVGALPSFQPPPPADAEEERLARRWACEYVERVWGADSPFRLTSTSLIAIARKPLPGQTAQQSE